MRPARDHVIDEIISILGGLRAVGEALGVTRQAVSQWKSCPHLQVLKLEKATGIPRHEIRPDLYPQPKNPEAAE